VAIVHDASSLGAAQGPLSDNGFGTIGAQNSATFSPPANSWIYVSIIYDDFDSGGGPGSSIPSNTGTALTWSLLNSHDDAFTTIEVWRAFNASAQTNIAFSYTGGTDLNNSGVGGNVGVFYVDVWTGANSSQSGAASQLTQTSTTTSNPSVTTTASGSQVSSAGGTSAGASYTSSDVILANTTVDFTARVYKSANSGAPGAVSVNYVTSGSPHNNFIVYEILAPATAAPFLAEPGLAPQSLRFQPPDTSRGSAAEFFPPPVPIMGQIWT
jgi:hypothetical protein